jgi:glycosyltransferase involved in cell wall biosynthesis
LVRKRLPNFELVLAGDIGDRFHGIPGVVCLGRVTDLREAYEAGSLALNPVDFGTGFCIKTLEALAYGMPLVSTKTGCRGLESLVSTKSFVCVPDKDSEAMASAILDLMENEDERERMAKAAWKVALDWSLRQKRSLYEAFGTCVDDTEIKR